MAETTPDVGQQATSLNPWSPLRVAVFRSLWLAGLVSNVGTFMHTVAAGWAITSLTSNPTLVSLLQAAWTVPGFLLALLAGALADVIDRRRLIIATQVASVAVAAMLGVLDMTDRLTVPLLLLFTFLLSSVGTLVAPAFMALTPELVDRSELPQAIGLNSISMNVAQAVGPALAGILIAAAEPGAVFLVNAASFLGIVVVVRAYRPTADHSRRVEHVGAAMRTGVRFFLDSPPLKRLAARMVLAWFVTSALMALMPVIARTKLRATAGQFGLLSAASGVGAVLAVWLLPRVRQRLSADTVALGSAVMWAGGAALFATSTRIPSGMAGLLLCGAGAMATMNIIFSMYQALLPAWVRGRASSVVMLVIWLGASVGAVVWGALASAIGVRSALVVAAAAHVVVTAVATVVLRLGEGDTVAVTVHAPTVHAPTVHAPTNHTPTSHEMEQQ